MIRQIKISNDERFKLIEMAKKLFPEYKHFGFQNDLEENGIMEFHNNDWNKMDLIHWFDFCFRYLVEAIQNKLPDDIVWRKKYGCLGEGNWTLYSHFLYNFPKNCRSESMIEWLYKEYKKIIF